jgi:hypothetical protein
MRKPKRIRPAKKKRHSLYAKLAAAENSPDLRQEIAKYGHHIPGVFRVEYWQRRFPKFKMVLDPKTLPFRLHRPVGLETTTRAEKECLLSIFFLPFMQLDDKFFQETADAIRAYKKTPAPYKWLSKLSDPALWLAHPAATLPEMEKFCGPHPGDLHRIVPRIGVPYTKRPPGHPKKK